MSIFTDLLESDALQKVIREVEKALFKQFFDLLDKIVDRTETTEDNEALALLLEEAADRVRNPAADIPV